MTNPKENNFNVRRPLVYICSPYAGEAERHAREARRYSRFAVEQGVIPLAPHLLFPQFLNDENAYERLLGLHFGMALLELSKEVWVFGERISSGMEAEINQAENLGIPLRYFNSALEEVLT